jgi:unsaturated chondroitin disaccharide hydrolase
LTAPWPLYLSAATREYERSVDRPDRLFPHYCERGRWELLDVDATSSWQGEVYEHGNWTAGFWFGTMWLAALGTGDEKLADLARERLPFLTGRATDATTHDLGFLFYPSVVLGHLSGFLSDDDVEPALEAARMTVRRFNEPGRYIQAFGSVGEARSAGTSTVDTMMNLPLLWWAHAVTGEARFLEVARQHARTSARLLVRPDASTIHLMRLDPVTGAFRGESTLQGAAPDSAWSRGQAWAVAGFAWSYAVTREPELLAAAERTAEYYHRHSGVDRLPAWDFADPSPDPVPDASAAAAVALGYLVLGEAHPDAAGRERYATAGRTLLGTIERDALNTDPDTDGVLLRSNYSVPHGRGVDGATAWGDFFAGLALAVADGVLPLSAVLGTSVRSHHDAEGVRR